MPVPFMSVALGIEEACSRRRRLTEGKNGRVWASEAGCEEGWIGLGEEENSGCGSGGGGGDRSSLGGAGFCSTSFGASRLDMSSPSSARRAMIFPTATFFVPSGVCFQPIQNKLPGTLVGNTYNNFTHHPIILRFHVYRSFIRLLQYP